MVAVGKEEEAHGHSIQGVGRSLAGHRGDRTIDARVHAIEWDAVGRLTDTLCPHPQYAHYDGGPQDDAASYSCRAS